MPGTDKSQRHVVRIRYQLVVGVFDSSLPIRYHQDVHLKALRKEEWLRQYSNEVESSGVKREPQANTHQRRWTHESYQKRLGQSAQ